MKYSASYIAALLSLSSVILLLPSCEKSVFPEEETEPQNNLPMVLSEKMAGDADGDFADGELLLMLTEDAYSQWENGDSAAVADMVRGDMRLASFRPALASKPKNEKLAKQLGLDRWFVAGFDSDSDVVESGAMLASSRCVEAVQFNRVASIGPSGTVEKYAGNTKSEPYFISDPLFSSQWNLYNDGSIDSNFKSGADVGAVYAWNLCGGDPGVVVAIIDGPVKYDHEDLARICGLTR